MIQIKDLSEKEHNTYFCCLEDWSDEMKEAGNHKECWFNKYKDKGLRVKLAVNENNKTVGMIQYIPIENSYINGKDLYFILCIWVHGYKQGVGNYQKKGIGTKLLEAAENDSRSLGAKGVAAWGIWLPFWMRAAWYKKHGYKKADSKGMGTLVWKAFVDNAEAPRWEQPQKRIPKTKGMVHVAAFINGWCPAQNIVYERTKKVCEQFKEKVIFQSIDTSDPKNFKEWGIVDAIYINGKALTFGPPPSYEKIYKIVSKKTKKV